MAAPRPQHDPQYLDPDHQRISEFAADYIEDDEEREGFVTEFMTRRGYTPTTRTEWAAPAPAPSGPKPPAGPRKPSYFKS